MFGPGERRGAYIIWRQDRNRRGREPVREIRGREREGGAQEKGSRGGWAVGTVWGDEQA